MEQFKILAQNCMSPKILYINSTSLFVILSDEGFGGWGRERSVKQRATGVSL
jgi:hypothetical protein